MIKDYNRHNLGFIRWLSFKLWSHRYMNPELTSKSCMHFLVLFHSLFHNLVNLKVVESQCDRENVQPNGVDQSMILTLGPTHRLKDLDRRVTQPSVQESLGRVNPWWATSLGLTDDLWTHCLVDNQGLTKENLRGQENAEFEVIVIQRLPEDVHSYESSIFSDRWDVFFIISKIDQI